MICRRNPLIPCLGPRCFSTIIVRNHLLLVSDILPVSSRCLTPCALAVLASVIILTLCFLHLHLPAQHSSPLNNIASPRQSRCCLPSAVLHDYGLPPKAYVYLHLALVLSPKGKASFYLCHAILTNLYLPYLFWRILIALLTSPEENYFPSANLMRAVICKYPYSERREKYKQT